VPHNAEVTNGACGIKETNGERVVSQWFKQPISGVVESCH